MSISARYSAKELEIKWYKHWEKEGYFRSTPDEREAYTIVIPPPNITGVLHMGHMLNITIQDVLIRRARLDGKNACWVPGTDHASIATEAKVVKHLRSKGIKKSDLTRQQFLEHAWEWKEEYGGIILSQLKKLGASCDWDRTAFTLDELRSKAVIKVFVDLYKKGKLYRQKRMVNWDPEAQTVLSNEEVLHHEEQGKLYKIAYKIVGSNEQLVIATTRPETILGDSGIAVHPNDERYDHLQGKKVIVPLVNRVIPIIFDDYVDKEFGTGVLKVTPAHDVNDYEIGKRHQLEVIEVLNSDGSISETGKLYIGKDRFKVREEIIVDLEKQGHLVSIEDYQHSVGRSERTNAVVEPRLSLQWYVDMSTIAPKALDSVLSDEVSFFPKSQKNLYKHWLTNIRDWCISRQLWWGHRIPAWFYNEEVFVAETVEEALIQAKDKFNNELLTIKDLKQDEDVLDTWFSSWLWPISVFDGFNNKKELAYYYPTNVLVTGWDIIFLWVARMVMAGFEWEQVKPFHHVYFTGMVRDKKRRKMSKSLGNSPDALKLIEDFGADGVRFGMLSCSPAGGDLLFDDKLCEQGRNFCNKMWNALRLIEGWEVNDKMQINDADKMANVWILQRKNELLLTLEKAFAQYKLSEAIMQLYSFVWGDFCSWYLEMIKPPYQEKISVEVKSFAKELFGDICIMLHPFMPFITEEIWHIVKENPKTDCIVSRFPENSEPIDNIILEKIQFLKSIVGNVRDIRNKNQIKSYEPISLIGIESNILADLKADIQFNALLKKIAVLKDFELVKVEPDHSVSFVSGVEKMAVIVEKEIDIAQELENLEKELNYQNGFVKSIEKKLSNDRFVNNAPKQVVEKERKKLNDGVERIRMIKDSIEKLK